MFNLCFLFIITNFLIRVLVNFSFDSENDSRKIISFSSSNSHSGIKKSSLSLLKYSVVFLIKIIGKPTDENFLVMRFTSKLKSLANLLALCISPVMVLRLYLVRIFEDQCAGSFFDFFFLHPHQIISVYKNFVRFLSVVNFMFG